MGEKQKSNRITILLLVSLLQMGVSALLLNNLSMDGWSVIYAEVFFRFFRKKTGKYFYRSLPAD